MTIEDRIREIKDIVSDIEDCLCERTYDAYDIALDRIMDLDAIIPHLNRDIIDEADSDR